MDNPNKFQILSMNCNSAIGKLDLIKSYTKAYDPDIISMTETKLNQNFDDNELLGDDYTIWRNDRDSRGGGVLVAIKNSSKISVLSSEQGPGESITLVIQVHPKIKFNLITFYRPPNEYFLDNLSEIVESHHSENSIFVGDFNLPDIDWDSNPGKGSVKTRSTKPSQHQHAIDIFTEADLKQMIIGPTHRCGNTLDLVLVNKSFLNDVELQCSTLPPISDHNMILIDLNIQKMASAAPGQCARLHRNYNKAKYDEIDQIFADIIEHFEQLGADIDQQWEIFSNATQEALSTIPRKLAKPNGQPWISREIVRMIRKRHRLYVKNERFPSIAHQDELDSLSHEIRIVVKKAKSDYLKNHLCQQMAEGNSKPLFNYLNKHSGRSNNISNIKDCQPHEIPDALAKHFSAVFSDANLPVPTNHINQTYPPMDPINIGRHGVELLLTSLDQRKAPGPDNISGITIKNFAKNCPSFVDCIFNIFTNSLKSGQVPTAWRKGVIRPIYKGGNRSDANNYRPICLTSIIAKAMEHILCSNMWRHINNYDIIKTHQHGFRKSLNTTTQLLHVIHSAAEAYDNKNDYHLISFDFSKAFDRVPHSLLLEKLKWYNFDPKCIQWIKNWLLDRTSVVSVNDGTSCEFPVRSGVPQGSVLGPLLFLLYIDDISRNVTNSECRLYADDTILCAIVTDPSLFQKDVDHLYRWALDWGMSFNALKCFHMQIGKNVPTIRFSLGGVQIPAVNSIKYLGVHIDSNLKWHTQVSKVTAKAYRALGCLKRNLKEAPKKTKQIAFNVMVKPILEYASQVWSPQTVGLSNTIEKVQNNALRWIYWLKKRDSITECRDLNNVCSLSTRRDQLDTIFLRKVECGLFDINLSDYIRFSTTYNTRGKVISWVQRTNAWKHSYFNRMRPQVKVIFQPNPPIN